jgi:hypothetical protein
VEIRGARMGASRSLLGTGWDYPVHGLRHPPENGTTGWYCWTGELSADPGFFVALHPEHLLSRLPWLVDYLDEPPGTRFLVAPGYSDVWHDETLLKT